MGPYADGILRAHGDLRGTVIDLPGPAARAEQAIISAGRGHHASTQAGLSEMGAAR